MTPFIQVTSDGTDEPMRQTVSWLGADPDDVVVPVLLELDPELQPAIASAAAAQAATAAILCRTAGVLAFLLAQTSRLARLVFGTYRRN
jgi:hypothetical protein